MGTRQHKVTGSRTRQRIVEAAFAEIHSEGFHAASVDRMIEAAGVTKGALYHHFESKQAVGLAVVSEVLGGIIRDLGAALANAPDPLTALRAWIEGPPPFPMQLGCPLNNLAQEMSSVDDRFRVCIEDVFAAWRGGIAEALARGQRSGHVRNDISAQANASFILAALQGTISMAKSARDEQLFRTNIELLSQYIESLRGHSSKE